MRLLRRRAYNNHVSRGVVFRDTNTLDVNSPNNVVVSDLHQNTCTYVIYIYIFNTKTSTPSAAQGTTFADPTPRCMTVKHETPLDVVNKAIVHGCIPHAHRR